MATDYPKSPSKGNNQSVANLELEIKNLRRDNQALQAELRKIKEAQNKKGKTLEQEKEMRLQANQDRYWLQQKLSRMQLAINARLKMLGIDFDNCDDLASALDAAFSAIQKLSVELQKKEEEVNEWEKKYVDLQGELDRLRGQLDKKEQNISKMKETMETQKLALSEKDKRIAQFGKDTERLSTESDQHERELAALRSQIENEKTKAQKQFDKLMESKQKWEEEMKQKENEAAEAQRLLQQELKAKDEELTKALKQLEALTKQFEASQSSNAQLQEQVNEMKDRIRDLENTLAIQDEEISGYKNDAEKNQDLSLELEKKLSEQSNSMSDRLKDLQSEKGQMLQAIKLAKDQLGLKDEEIKKLRQLLDQVKRDLEKSKQDHDDYMNRPREDKAVQTDISNRWFDDTNLKLADLERLRGENDRLANELAFADNKVRGLVTENKALVDEIDYLIKQAAKFKPDSANHSGGVLTMCCAPNKYMCATSATDKSVRLWKVNIEADGKEEKVFQVYASSHLERQAPALAFSKDGTYLAGGIGQRDNPNGSILVWNMSNGEGEVQTLFRSRETVRFGGVYCLCFSDNNRYIFAGDTTGTVWVWDMQYNLQLVEVHMHKDVVQSCSVGGGYLISTSFDQTMSMFELNRLEKVKVNVEKLHLWKPKEAKSKEISKDDRYPWWQVCTTDDGKSIIAGGRKICVFAFDGEKVSPGPSVVDTDTDHIDCLRVKRNMILVCRKNTPRAKLFDLVSGKEINKSQYKNTVTKVDFLYNLQHIAVCCQLWEKEVLKPPSMHLWDTRK